jgi:hypothetical protein
MSFSKLQISNPSDSAGALFGAPGVGAFGVAHAAKRKRMMAERNTSPNRG